MKKLTRDRVVPDCPAKKMGKEHLGERWFLVDHADNRRFLQEHDDGRKTYAAKASGLDAIIHALNQPTKPSPSQRAITVARNPVFLL